MQRLDIPQIRIEEETKRAASIIEKLLLFLKRLVYLPIMLISFTLNLESLYIVLEVTRQGTRHAIIRSIEIPPNGFGEITLTLPKGKYCIERSFLVRTDSPGLVDYEMYVDSIDPDGLVVPRHTVLGDEKQIFGDKWIKRRFVHIKFWNLDTESSILQILVWALLVDSDWCEEVMIPMFRLINRLLRSSHFKLMDMERG